MCDQQPIEQPDVAKEAARFTAAIARGATVVVHPTMLAAVRAINPEVADTLIASEAILPQYILAVEVSGAPTVSVEEACQRFGVILAASRAKPA